MCNQRNQRNQSETSTSQSHAVDHVEHREEHTPTSCDDVDYVDYTDYSDYADYTDDRPSPDVSSLHERPSSTGDAALEQAPAMGLQETEVPRQNDHREHTVISVINRHQTGPLAPRPVGQADGDSAPIANKNRCPHHPYTQWIRFDPAGQAWCDKMDCWDCYRLMRIGEALGYRQLAGRTSTIGQGIEAWSSFVTSQGPFAIMTATQQAIDLCEALGVEVPGLSVEVQHLVSAP